MALFGFRKKDDVVDLTEHFKEQSQGGMTSSRPQGRAAQMREGASTPQSLQKENISNSSDSQDSGVVPFPFFGAARAEDASETTSTSSDSSSDFESPHEKRRKLAKRLSDMTSKMEDLSNQVYHLQQRVEVLERKNDANRI